MVTTWCLLACVLAPAQSAERSEWLVLPRLSQWQELLYRGTHTEDAAGGGVQFRQTYSLEARVFVLDTPAQGADLALFTALKSGDERKHVAAAKAEFVRLELVHLGLQGRLTADPGVSLTLPLEGPPSLECGAFVELPKGRLALEQSWDVAEEGRGVRTWRVSGIAPVGAMQCLKLVGTQQSDDWEQPRADHTAWRRTDTVWLAPRLGVAQRVERVIERRVPAHPEATQKSVTQYELESTLQYPGQLAEDRRREIVQAHAFRDSLTPLLDTPAKSQAQLEALRGKIARHVESQPSTPYREEVLSVERRLESALRGETPPARPHDDTTTPARAQVGQTAPDFLTTEFLTGETARLRRWQGKPVLMVFYSPASETAGDVLRFAQSIGDANAKRLTVVGLAMTDDAERVGKQKKDLHLTFPVLHGSGLRQSYAVESTPKLILLDAEGMVRASYDGWGEETSSDLLADLKRCLR
jgi:peroxiredoxin